MFRHMSEETCNKVLCAAPRCRALHLHRRRETVGFGVQSLGGEETILS